MPNLLTRTWIRPRLITGAAAAVACSLVALADHYIPPRFVQTGHGTPWTSPEASTKSVSVNDIPGSGPVPTPFLVDWNCDYLVYRLKDVNLNNSGNVCCADYPWTHDITLRFAVESEHLAIGVDVVPYDDNPQKELAAAPIPPVGMTPTGLLYDFVFPAGLRDLPVWFAFRKHVSPPTLADLNEVSVRLVGALDTQQPPVQMGAGWNAHVRFIVEGWNADLELFPVNDPGSGPVVHFGSFQATTKIPVMDTEVLHEGNGYGLGPGNVNEYKWHRIWIKEANVELAPGTWRFGEDEAQFDEPLTITLHMGEPSGAMGAATAGEDFNLITPNGVWHRQGTVPETWQITIPAGSTHLFFGVRVLRETPMIDENGWEELILVLGEPDVDGGGAGTSFPPGSTLTPPEIGWKDRMRFLIQDGE
ncbi:MAG: hypothetical protein GY711_03160 [bacterium]|nr:hypothetical protein [bacterium]